MIIATITLATVLPVFIKYFEPYDIVIRILSPFTASIPAILPVCMSLGILFAYGRLYFGNIYCTVPQKINAAGRVSTMVFDKTGTLTHDGLAVVAMKTANNSEFDPTIKDPQGKIESFDFWNDPEKKKNNKSFLKFVECMAC